MTSGEPLVLVVEDDPPILRFLRISLTNNGFRYEEASSGGAALARFAELRPDLVILDLGLPDRDGIGVLRELRSFTNVPVVVLSARDREVDKVMALDSGADDYLSKPFGAGELLARLRVALRHAAAAEGGAVAPVVTIGDLTVDLDRRLVAVAGREVHLTRHEFGLLAQLSRHAGKVLTHRQLLRAVWGPEYGDESHYVRVFMAQLRRKIEADPARPRWLLTEPGVGYRLRSEE
jgi:two-component system KDP operon response regulator KdpE